MLPCFSKTLEGIMYNRLYVHVSEHNLLFERQFAFWAGYSTEHTIGEITVRLLDSFDQNLQTLGKLIDLSKAFDSVNHMTLLKSCATIVEKSKGSNGLEVTSLIASNL